MASQEATKLHAQLVQEWAKADKADQPKVKTLLAQLKIELSELGLLFPTVEAGSKPDVRALTAAREILEIGAYQSIRSNDVPAFERYLSLLGSYYNDLGSVLPKSTNEAPLIALSLLRLLSLNNIAGFHTLLETLPATITDSKEVTWVTHLEQCLMEGSYSRVWQLCRPNSSAKHPLPEPSFAFAPFVASLVDTVRAEIAACDEKAYETLPLVDAKTLLFFESEGEVREFAKKRDWYIDPKTSVVHFPSSASHPSKLVSSASTGIPTGLASGTGPDGKELDKVKVIASALLYAKELESIV
ncbi:hypothetical protein T439DRAFT_302081 [Meredithblackwellia eburnea MCA 4105]